jgi:predicted RNA-binding Zn-ribbon protein involved in translation (DUF1610 family)
MSRYPIFDELQSAKLFLSMRGDKLNVRPSSNVTPALAEFIRTNKAELVDMIERGQDLPPCERCQGAQWAVRTFDHYENFECQQCGVCSGCRRVGNELSQERFSGRVAA